MRISNGYITCKNTKITFGEVDEGSDSLVDKVRRGKIQTLEDAEVDADIYIREMKKFDMNRTAKPIEKASFLKRVFSRLFV